MPAGSEIHYLTKPGFKSLLDQNPYLHRIWLLEGSLLDTIRSLKEEKFDLIVDLHHNLRTFWIKLLSGVKSVSFEKLNFRKFLLTRFKIRIMPGIHIVDRYLQTVVFLGIKNDGMGLDYFYPAPAESLNGLIPPGLEYNTLAIGGQHATKRLPLPKLIGLVQAGNIKLVIIGGKEDAAIASEISNLFPEKVINLAGKLNLHQSAAVIKKGRVLITHDTGMMHIASALKIPIVVIWGNTVPELGMYPYYGRHEVPYRSMEVKGLSCRPCSKLGYAACPKQHFNCMNLQPVDEIVKAAENLV